MSTSLASILVSSATYGYLGSVFTRDAFFSFSTYVLFWLIFAFTYYGGELTENVFFYIPMTVILASVTGITVVKLLNIGQLIDVWLTGAGGGDNNRATRNEELNIPLLLIAIIFTYFAVFFAVAAIACDSLTCASFLGGIWAVQSNVVGWLLFGVFFALALLCLFASGIQLKRGVRYNRTQDYMSIFYTFAFIVMAFGPAAAWHLSSWTPIVRGWVAGGVAIIADVAFLGFGAAYEHERDVYKDNVGVQRSRRRGRFYSIEGSSIRLIFRFLIVILLHAATYVLGGYAIDATGGDVSSTWAWFLVYWGAAFIVFATIYVVLAIFFLWQDTSNDDIEEGKPLTPPNEEVTTNPSFTEATEVKTSVASRTRQRTTTAVLDFE